MLLDPPTNEPTSPDPWRYWVSAKTGWPSVRIPGVIGSVQRLVGPLSASLGQCKDWLPLSASLDWLARCQDPWVSAKTGWPAVSIPGVIGSGQRLVGPLSGSQALLGQCKDWLARCQHPWRYWVRAKTGWPAVSIPGVFGSVQRLVGPLSTSLALLGQCKDWLARCQHPWRYWVSAKTGWPAARIH